MNFINKGSKHCLSENKRGYFQTDSVIFMKNESFSCIKPSTLFFLCGPFKHDPPIFPAQNRALTEYVVTVFV